MGERAWVKSLGKKLREDLGDNPVLPSELVRLLDKLREQEQQKQPERPSTAKPLPR